MSHLLPPNENARLAALNELALLDTPNEPVFDRITRLASEDSVLDSEAGAKIGPFIVNRTGDF